MSFEIVDPPVIDKIENTLTNSIDIDGRVAFAGECARVWIGARVSRHVGVYTLTYVSNNNGVATLSINYHYR